jgi:hypothetical protein
MRLAAVALALLAVLAGCNAPPGPADTASPTATPSTGGTPTASPTATPTPAPDPADAGLAADGVVDPAALARAHDARLEKRSFTLGRSVTVRGPDGDVLVQNRRVTRAADGGDLFVWNATAEADGAAPLWLRQQYAGRSERAYSNATTTFVLVESGGQRHVTTYTERDGPTPFLGAGRSLTGSDLVRQAFAAVDTRVTDVSRSDGTVVYDLAAGDGPHALEENATGTPSFEVLSLSAAVERSGVVRRVELRYAVERDGRRYTVREVQTVVDVGSTAVRRPAWVGAHLNGSAAP